MKNTLRFEVLKKEEAEEKHTYLKDLRRYEGEAGTKRENRPDNFENIY